MQLQSKAPSSLPGQAELAPAGPEDAQSVPDTNATSIYDLYSPLRRNLIIFTAAFGFLLSFCTSIYLPALKMVADDLHIGPELVAATVGIYFAMFGLAALIWGPASDRFGRMPIYVLSCVGNIGACLGCMFSPKIQLLLVFRALQGGTVAAFMVTALAVVADVVRPEARGQATAVTSVAVALGTVVTPLAGGALANAFGWRSTFAALATSDCLFGLTLFLAMRQETHQRFLLQRLAKTDPDKAAAIVERDIIMAAPTRFEAPWMPLKHIFDLKILPHALTGILVWIVLKCILNEMLPVALASAPYSLSATLLGVALLVDAVTTLTATPLGGLLSDKCAAGQDTNTTGVHTRLMPNTLGLLLLGPVGALGTGWALQYQAHIAIVLGAVSVVSFGGYFYLPGMFSYITTVKQSNAASAIAGVQSIMGVASGLVVIVGGIARKQLGYGWWLSILGVSLFVVTAVAVMPIVREQRLVQKAMRNMPAVALPAVGALASGDIAA